MVALFLKYFLDPGRPADPNNDTNGVLFLNPSGAAPRRFHQPVTVALLCLIDKAVASQVVELQT